MTTEQQNRTVPRQHTPEHRGAAPATEPVVEHSATEIEMEPRAERKDIVRWGPVWAGLVVTLASFLLMEMVFFAFGWLTLQQGETGTSTGLVSALIGLVAFFLGGLVAGATALWRSSGRGGVHGVLVWALGLVGILFLTLFGGGALFGAASGSFGQIASLQNVPDIQAGQALSTVRDGAVWAVVGIIASLVAAVAGGMVGAKMGDKDTATH